MMPQDQLPDLAAALLSGASAVLFLAVLRKREAPRETLGASLLFLGVGIYLGGLLSRFGGGVLALVMPADLYGISGVALTMAGLFVARFQPLPGLWGGVAAVATVFFAAAGLMPREAMEGGQTSLLLLTLHIGFIAGAAGFLLLLGVLAGLYVVKEGAMRRDPTGWGRRLPNLEHIDRYQLRSMQIGFVLLTIGMAFGVLLMFSVEARTARADVLALVTAVVWGLLGGVLYLRQYRQWGGHRLAVVSGVVIALLLVTLVVTFGVGPLRHGAGG